MYWHSIPNTRIQKLGLFECLPLSQHSKDLQFSHQSCYSGNHIVDHYTFAFNTEYCVIYFRKYQSFPTSTSIVCLVGCVRCQVETLPWMALLCQQVCHGRSIRPCMGEGSVVCEVNHATDSQLTAPWNKAIKGSRHLVPPLYCFPFKTLCEQWSTVTIKLSGTQDPVSVTLMMTSNNMIVVTWRNMEEQSYSHNIMKHIKGNYNS